MKVLFIHNRYRQPGGEDAAVELETTILRQYGHQVQLLLFDNEITGGAWSKIQSGIQAVYNKTSEKLVEETILSFQPDLVHVHNFFFKASPSIFFAASKLKIPVVMTLHNYRLICSNALLLRNGVPCELCILKKFPVSGIRYRCYRDSMSESAMVTAVTGIHKTAGTWQKKINRFIVLTSFAKNKLANSSLHCDDSKFVIKPNFVTDNGQGQYPRKGYYFFAGRIAKEKGAAILAKAFSELKFPVVIAGEGPDKEMLEHEYQEYQNISFIGAQSRQQVIDLMKECRALVFPSIWYEGLPFVILEAFSTGTPVIVSNIGSMTEMIKDGYNGYHFPAGDTEGLKMVIRKFESDSGLQKELYSNARQTFLDLYRPDVHYNSIMKLYEEIIAEQ